MFLIENTSLGITITKVEIATLPGVNIGEVKDSKCIGYTEKQCIESYIKHLETEIEESEEFIKGTYDNSVKEIAENRIRENNILINKLQEIEKQLKKIK